MKKTLLLLVLAAYSSSIFSQISFIEKKEIKEEPKTFIFKYDSLRNVEPADFEHKFSSDSADFYGHLIGQTLIHVGGIYEGSPVLLEMTTKGKGKRTKTITTTITESPKIGTEFTVIDVSPKKTTSDYYQKIILKENLTGKTYIYDPRLGYYRTEWIVKGYYEKMKQLYVGKSFYYINTCFYEGQQSDSFNYSSGLFDIETDEKIKNIKDFSKWKCVDASIKIDDKILYAHMYIQSYVVLIFENEEGNRYYTRLQTSNKKPLILNYSHRRREFGTGDKVLRFRNIWIEQDIELHILHAEINEKEILAGKFLNEEQYQKIYGSIEKINKIKAERAAADAKERDEEKRIKEEREAERAAADAKAKEDAKRRAAARKSTLIAKYGEAVANDMLKGHVRLGWTKEMCIEAWGRPEDINRTIGDFGVYEQWVYGLKNYLYFENGKLTGIQD